MAQGETPLLHAVVDPHNIRRQHFLMLGWVLLCDYCSFYYQLSKTSELGRATTAHIIVTIYFRDHYLWFKVCSVAEFSSAFIIPPPRALQWSTSTFPPPFFRVTSYEHGACPPRLYTVVYYYAPCRRSDSTGSFLLQRIALHGPTLALPYNTILSQRNIDGFWLYVLLLTSSIRGHLLSLKFHPHRATRTLHRQHRTGVIHGTKLSPQHSQKGQKTIQNGQKLQGTLHPLGARMRATASYKARICAQGAVVWRKTRAPAKRRIYGNWSASQPLMDRLPSRFDTKFELNPHGGLVKDLIVP
jgi:hypothetical protein